MSATRVVFLQEVPGVAQAGEVKQVAPGFARNYLIPKGLAMVATTAALNTWKDRQRAEEKRSLSRQEQLQGLHSRLSEMTVTLRAKTGGKERLYGALTAGHIATELKHQGITVDRKDIELSGSIRRLGEHKVQVHIGPGIQAELKVIVEPLGE